MTNHESLLKAQIEKFNHAVEKFSRCVASLSDEIFLKNLNGWSPRDIVAHLIGWNRYVIEGGRQIKSGELPFYDIDPGVNYSHVNAVLVRKYASNNKQELLHELQISAQELSEFLTSLNPADWEHDFGVRHNGAVITIQNTIEEFIEDYSHHQAQIEELLGIKG